MDKATIKEGELKLTEPTKDLIGKCWTLVTSSLHDDLFLKLVHVEPGAMATLMQEIRSALLVNIAEDIQPVRLELYNASMQRDCNNDLQSFIAYIIQRNDKLLFLKVKVPDEELVHIFLKGLPFVFQPLQVHYAIPGNTPASFGDLVATTRKFASSPVVAAELAKLKSNGVSQNIFTSVSRLNPPTATKEKQYCFKYSKTGSCSFGDKCRYYHATNGPTALSRPSSSAPSVECSYCHFKGHTIQECRKRASKMGKASVAVASHEEPDAKMGEEEQNNNMTDPFVFVFSVDTGENKHSGWVLDSGATSSATYDATDCTEVEDCSITITAAGCSFVVYKKGTARIPVMDKNGNSQTISVKNCLISEKFPFKLLAIQALAKKGHSVLMEGDEIFISNKANNFVIYAAKEKFSKLYFLSQKIVLLTPHSAHSAQRPGKVLLAKSYDGSAGGDLLWKLHLRHGHKNFVDICRQYSMPVPKIIPACTSCVMGKAHLHPHLSSGFTRATRPAEGFHSDFRGPFATPTPSGHLYMLTIIDDYSRRVFAFLVKSQSEWFEIWSKFVIRVEAELGKTNCISWLLSDNGGVYKSQIMSDFCSQRGIQQRHSAPYSQFMDHTAERNMRTIGEMMTTTMLHANMPRKAWGFAALHAAEVLNRTTESAISNKAAGVSSNFSRLERWKGKAMPGQTKGLYPFGCLAFKHIPGVLRTKLDAHATPSVYLGLDAASRAYLLGTIYELATSVSVEVTFFENVFPFRKLKIEDSQASLLWDPSPSLQIGDPRLGVFDTKASDASKVSRLLEPGGPDAITTVSDPPTTPVIDLVTPTDDKTEEVKSDMSVQDIQPVLRRSTRVVTPMPQTNQKYRVPLPSKKILFNTSGDDGGPTEETETFAFISVSEATLEVITPRHAFQALRSKQQAKWLSAMNREKECHSKNGTFDYVTTAPPGVKVIPADWVFKLKYRGGPIDADDIDDKLFKARVVIRGQYMQEGLNYNNTFAPVAKPATIRALLATATKYGCLLFSGDVETAFLTAKMDCEVWVKMPPFWGKNEEAITGAEFASPPRLLLKGVPGIPQGSRLFYLTFAAHLLTMGFKPTDADKCLFINFTLAEKNAVLLWVDDFLFLCEQEGTYQWFIASVRAAFNVPSSGPLVTFLGMNVIRDVKGRTMSINQENSINVLLERSKLSNCNSAATPCVSGAVFTKADSPPVADKNDTTTDFRSLIAMANFISCWTRPDITFTVNKLCKFMSNPGETHWHMLKHLLRYLAGTRSNGITFNFSDVAKPDFCDVYGYSDSSFADCPDTSRSTLAYVFFFAGAILSWYSKLNTYVTTCTNHSEYNALALAAKEAEWLVLLFSQLLPNTPHTPVPILVDNSGVVSMVYNPVDHQSNKHVKIGCHYSRELTEGKIIIPQRVSSERNIADLFTKPLGVQPFNKLASLVVAPKPTHCETTLITHSEFSLLMQADNTESDSDVDTDDADGTSHEEYRRDWPHVNTVKAILGATRYNVETTGQYDLAGRKGLEITFFNADNEAISRHEAMMLGTRTGRLYYVCKNVPRESQVVARNTTTTSNFVAPPPETRAAPLPASISLPVSPAITLGVPPSLLSCLKCGRINTTQFSNISCALCNGVEFQWTACCCTMTQERKEPPRPPGRPRRNVTAKSWTQRVKYAGPIRRGLMYHHENCKMCPEATTVVAIEFATAYRMKPAPCCF